MALPSRRDFDELLGSWSNRTSLFQFVVKDMWEIPVVRSFLAPLAVAGPVTAGGMHDATAGYAAAFALGALAYLAVWARLNLKQVFASVLRQASEHDIVEENKREGILQRKKDIGRFVIEDFN